MSRPAVTARSQKPVPPARIPIPPRSPSDVNAIQRMRAEVRDAERLIGVDEVEAVVDDPPPLLGRRLGRADVQAAVHLPRVGGDHLGRAPIGDQPLGEDDGEPGLAGRRGTADHDERRDGQA